MKKLFVAVTITCLGTILASISAYASSDAFDGKGNLFVADAYSGTIFKYTPDGIKSTFASGLMPDGGYDMAFDRLRSGTTLGRFSMASTPIFSLH